MENFYELINNEKQEIKKRNVIIDQVYIDYYVGFILEKEIDDAINKIQIYNIDQYKDLSNLDIVDVVKIYRKKLNEYISAYYDIDANEFDYSYIISQICNSLETNKIGHLKNDENDSVEFEINATLKNLIDIYNVEVEKYNINNKKDYYSIIQNLINNYESFFSEEIISNLFYDKFLNDSIVKVIKCGINRINILNYNEAEIKVNQEFFIKKDKSFGNKGTSIDIFVPKEYYDTFVATVQNFVDNYYIGQISYDSAACGVKIFINTNLNNLVNAYYMEMQRVEYLTEDEKQKGLAKK